MAADVPATTPSGKAPLVPRRSFLRRVRGIPTLPGRLVQRWTDERRAALLRALAREPRPAPLWVAHAGLCREPGLGGAEGGTPTMATLRRCRQLRADMVELDVNVTADGQLVLRHDSSVVVPLTPVGPAAPSEAAQRRPQAMRRAVSELTLAELRAVVPQTLTLDEGLRLLGDTRVLIDVKTVRTAHALAAHLRSRTDQRRLAVCTELVDALLILRDRAPLTPRWLTLPDAGSTRRDGILRAANRLWSYRRGAMRGHVLGQVRKGLRDLPVFPTEGIARICSIPWSLEQLGELRKLAARVGATGLSVNHRLVTPELVQAARDLRLEITAWTVNNEQVAGYAALCGVSHITSDRLEEMRRALGAMLPGTANGPGTRAVA